MQSELRGIQCKKLKKLLMMTLGNRVRHSGKIDDEGKSARPEIGRHVGGERGVRKRKKPFLGAKVLSSASGGVKTNQGGKRGTGNIDKGQANQLTRGRARLIREGLGKAGP